MADVSPTLASSRSLITALSRPTSPVRAPSLPPAIARVRFSLLRELSRRSTHNFSLSLSLSPSAFLSLAPGHSGFLLLLLGPFPRFHVARPALFVPPLPLASTRCPMTSFVHPLSLRSPLALVVIPGLVPSLSLVLVRLEASFTPLSLLLPPFLSLGPFHRGFTH